MWPFYNPWRTDNGDFVKKLELPTINHGDSTTHDLVVPLQGFDGIVEHVTD